MRRAAADADCDDRCERREQSGQNDRYEHRRYERHVLLELEREETADDREDALGKVDDPGGAIDEDERHPDDPEEGSGRDADHDQLQKSRHVRRLDPSPR